MAYSFSNCTFQNQERIRILMVDPRIIKVVLFFWPNQFKQSILKVISQTLSNSRLLFIATEVELVYILLQWPCFLSSPSVWGSKLADLPVL